MYQTTTSPCGFRFKNVNLDHSVVDGKERSTVDLYNDLEKAYFEYNSGKDRFQYVKLAELTNEFLSTSFNGIIGMLDSQVANVELNGAGWDFLVLVSQYAIDTMNHDPMVNESGKALDRNRARIGTYFSTPSFKSTQEVDAVANSKSRQETLRAFRSKNNANNNDLPISKVFIPMLYADRVLLCNFLNMLLFKG